MMEEGKLYGVSVGPGDPELMTLRAVRAVREADVIAVPNGKKENCAAYKIALAAVPEIGQKECLMIPMPMTKDEKQLEKSHREGAERILRELRRGKSVALLTLGDVSVYSTCWYLYRLVREAHGSGELISGVPSFCAAAARLDRVLVCGSQSLHILPASYPVEEGLKLSGVKVLMKMGSQGALVRQFLLDNGFSACGVERCGMEGERLYRNTDEIREDAGYYSLLIVDEQGEGKSGWYIS